MLNTKLPKNRYDKITYPNLEDRANGAPIPLAYGDLHGVIPVCIDTIAQKFKNADHAIHALDEVRREETPLVPIDDYSTVLAAAEFDIVSSPFVAAGEIYYFVIEADYDPDPNDYLKLKQYSNVYADGNLFRISDAGVWTSVPGKDLRFIICGKLDLSDPWHHQIDNRFAYDPTPPAYTYVGLRDSALPCARYRLAQSFKPTTDFYLTSVKVYSAKPPKAIRGKNVRVSILSSAGAPVGAGEVQVGEASGWTVIEKSGGSNCVFELRTESANYFCDIEGAEKAGAMIIDGADMIEDLVVNRLGKSSSILEPVASANFKAKRTQEIAAYIDSDTTFGEIIGKLESSLLFKFAPLHDGTYAAIVYEAGEPAGTPHLFDEHFLSFSMQRNFSAVKSITKVKYDEDRASDTVFKVAEHSSDVARFVYGMEETLEIETFLKSGTDALALASDCSGMYETPPLEIKFEVRGYGLNLIPGRDKVRITRTRAAYAGGTMSGVLFRIVKIMKKPTTNSTEITAVLDTQTY